MATENPRLSDEEGELYRQMKTTRGGVMLLVRLRADLARTPQGDLQRMASFRRFRFPKKSRISVTYRWLVDKFGLQNARRAVAEAAAEVLREYPSQAV